MLAFGFTPNSFSENSVYFPERAPTDNLEMKLWHPGLGATGGFD